ncbi:MAG: hypothetical protein CMJ18_18205 [Phycisphaeraceae bacterium]|nr:hypothetical protein [Phycisphaeraceae bacterium]
MEDDDERYIALVVTPGAVVPEPLSATLGLTGLGALGVAVRRRRA